MALIQGMKNANKTLVSFASLQTEGKWRVLPVPPPGQPSL